MTQTQVYRINIPFVDIKVLIYYSDKEVKDR